MKADLLYHKEPKSVDEEEEEDEEESVPVLWQLKLFSCSVWKFS